MSEQPTEVIERVPAGAAPAPESAPTQVPRLSAPRPRLKLEASAGVWVGLVVAALGFGAIFYSWVKVAGMLEVGRQMPYVVSGAMTGLGLVVVGIAVIDMAVRRQDRGERRQQMALLQTLLEELRQSERDG